MVFASLFAILVGLGMIGQWSVFYYTNQIPELETEPIRIGFHLAAELATALILVTAGVGLLATTTWGKPVFLVAMGMLFYTAIISPGYFAQQRQYARLGMFGAIIILGILSILLVL